METDGKRIVVHGFFLMALRSNTPLSTMSPEEVEWALYLPEYVHTCNCCTSLINPAGRTSRMLSKFISFQPAISANLSRLPVGEAKRPAATTPTKPPSPNIHAFRLLRPRCLEIFAASCEGTILYSVAWSPGRTGAGLASRELLGVLSGVPTPKMRRRRSDMALFWQCKALRIIVSRKPEKGGRCLARVFARKHSTQTQKSHRATSQPTATQREPRRGSGQAPILLSHASSFTCWI